VSERPSRKLDERVPNGLPIREIALAKPTKTDQVIYRSRRNYYLDHHRAPPAALAATALPLGCR
jgi:hypothetical protein